MRKLGTFFVWTLAVLLAPLAASSRRIAVLIQAVPQEHAGAHGAVFLRAALFNARVQNFDRAAFALIFARLRRRRAMLADAVLEDLVGELRTLLFAAAISQAASLGAGRQLAAAP